MTRTDTRDREALGIRYEDWPGVSLPHPGMVSAYRCYFCDSWIFEGEPRRLVIGYFGRSVRYAHQPR